MKKSHKIIMESMGSMLMILGVCLLQSCIQQEDLFKSPLPETVDQCITPLYIDSQFAVHEISMAPDASLIAVINTLEGLYLFNCRGDIVWSNDNIGGRLSMIAEEGGYIFAQIRRHAEKDPFFLVKLDSDGNTVWKREIGLIGLDGLAVTPDGSFVVVGATDEEKKGHLMLFDRDGNELWEHQIDGRIETVAVSKSGYVVAGPRDRYIYLYDKDGELVFKHFAGSYYSARDVAIAPDETYFLFGSEHRYLSCYTLEGDLLWQREVGPLYNIRISTDGECIVVGTSRSTLFFFDRNGGKLWDKKVTDAFFIDEIAISGHGEYIAIDTMEFSSPLSQRYIAVYSKEGDFLWRYQSVYPNPFVAIAMSNDGHYIAAGNRGLFLLFDNFQAIEEYKSSECAQSDTSHVSDPDQRILLLGQPGLIPFLTVLLIAILVGILIIIYLSRRKIEKKA